MRTRNIVASILVVGVWTACSQPANESSPESASEPAAVPRGELALALTADSDAEASVVSELEAAQSTPRVRAQQVSRQASSTKSQAPAIADQAAEVEDAAAHDAAESFSEPAPELTVVAMGGSTTPVRMPARMPAAVEGARTEGDESAEPRGEDVDAGRRGGGVVIRGGRGSGLDPCVVHTLRPQRPSVGALVNDRAPRIGFSPRGGIR